MGAQRLQEMEFELALTGNLEDVYDLRVRSARDPLNRRQSGYTTLSFGYSYDPRKPGAARVRVQIEARKRPSYRFDVDLSDPDQVESVAADCEELALAIQGYLDKQPEPIRQAALRRREDD